jgi:hypothetical protein
MPGQQWPGERKMTEVRPDYTIRASSLPTFFDCPERWAETHPQFGNIRMPSGAAAAIGTATHFGTGRFDMERLLRIVPSAEAAIDAAVQKIKEPDGEVIWDDFTLSEAKDIAARLTQNYCIGFASRFQFDAVEMPMNHWDVQAANGLIIRFTGTIDRRRVITQLNPADGSRRERKGICDLKTGANVISANGEVNTKVSGAQMAMYELLELLSTNTLGKSDMLPAMIFAFPTKGKHQPAAAEVRSPHRLLIGDAHHKGAIDIIADTLKSGNFWGNARSTLCGPRYCPKHGKCRWQMSGEIIDG